MASETAIQAFVHKLEEGGWAKWIRRAVLVTAVAYVVNLWMFHDSGFKGLNHERSIEQAQIAREIARGNGFSTKMIRPLKPATVTTVLTVDTTTPGQALVTACRGI